MHKGRVVVAMSGGVDSIREMIVEKFKQLGYAYTTLDLLGYRTGSMNETL